MQLTAVFSVPAEAVSGSADWIIGPGLRVFSYTMLKKILLSVTEAKTSSKYISNLVYVAILFHI